MEEKFKGLFIGKTEKFFFATMCRACFNEGVTGLPIRKIVSGTDRFELVQMSENP
jgi:hypothetical protein